MAVSDKRRCSCSAACFGVLCLLPLLLLGCGQGVLDMEECPPDMVRDGGLERCMPVSPPNGENGCVGEQVLCEGECVLLSSDPDHCGACEVPCGEGSVCVGGSCELHCAPGLTECQRRCVDLSSDPHHCGACAAPCIGDEVCVDNACVLDCGPGRLECDGRCVNPMTDAEHCGACRSACPSGSFCVNGACDLDCAPGLTECAGQCVDTQTDTRHCGGCGVSCGAGSICVNGTCRLDCSPGLTECAGHCVDTQTDTRHCGGCGVSCGSGSLCVGGACRLDCAAPLTECAGQCVDLQSDVRHCGTCQNACLAQQECINGHCEAVTQPPLTARELDLYQAINDYRASEGLPPIPLSYSLTFVARTHVQDLIDHGSTVLAGDCNLHSWSDQGNWTACCYTPDHAQAGCMWSKPRELTNYRGDGYEISASGVHTASSALGAWQSSTGHRNVILNEGMWSSLTWRAIGVGIDGGYSHVWFGTAVDPDDFP